MANYFTSDWHLGHKSILKYREQFKTVEEHDEAIFTELAKLNKRDILYVLGDFLFDCENFEQYLERISKFPCRIKLVLGNHDNAEFKKRGVSLEMLQSVFEDRIYGFARKHGFWVSHCPIAEEELRGRINLHGHVHNKTIQKFGYLNLSMENINYKPISLDKIRENIKNGIIHNLNG